MLHAPCGAPPPRPAVDPRHGRGLPVEYSSETNSSKAVVSDVREYIPAKCDVKDVDLDRGRYEILARPNHPSLVPAGSP